jgi:DNA (cytosine-5)-methyltransferase 1
MPRKNTYITATDQFCGAGGSTTAAKLAGVDVKMALNHWDLAIETHNTNHPDTSHDCTDIQACDPRRYPSTNILITSPECTNHSLAKGRKRKFQAQLDMFGTCKITPEEERSRATMWDVPRFAEFHDYEIVIVENVVDARYWRMWNAWLLAMHSLGYDHKCLYLNSMFFHPCPQSRDRMYVVFWKKGNRKPELEYRPIAPCPGCGDKEAYQSWKRPEKKWGKYKQQYVYRCSSCMEEVVPYFYCAMNVVDWSVPITRIGDRKRPLADKTIQRIKYGLEKYGQQPMVVTGRYTSGLNCRVKSARHAPLPTQPGDPSHFLLSQIHFHSDAYSNKVKLGTSPGMTQTTRQEHNILVPPAIVNLRNNANASSSLEAIKTVTAGGINHALLFGCYSPGWSRGLDQPTGSMTTTAQQALLTSENFQAFLTYYYGSHTASRMTDALNTVTTTDRAAVAACKAGRPEVEDCFYRCLKPHEVQRAMSFSEEYIVIGNSRQKVKQLGNAVTPPVMEWIVKQCVSTLA